MAEETNWLAVEINRALPDLDQTIVDAICKKLTDDGLDSPTLLSVVNETDLTGLLPTFKLRKLIQQWKTPTPPTVKFVASFHCFY